MTLAVAPAVGLGLVARRDLLDDDPLVFFGLRPGDRPLVAEGDPVESGRPIAEHLRDVHLEDVPGPVEGEPGAPWEGEIAAGSIGLRRHPTAATGELLYEAAGRWRLAVGEHVESLESPIAGIVTAVRPGIGITVRASGRSLRGTAVIGGVSHGVLAIAGGSDADPRPRGLDVGAAGQILVVGSRVDAETMTRARAMGVRGIVVSGLPGKERRDFLASEARQRASLHGLPPFAVFILDGTLRRPFPSPVQAAFAALAGREVGIVADPPRLVFDATDVALPTPEPERIRIRSGELAGVEGQWAGLAGSRRFGPGTHLEAGYVRLADDEIVAVPLGDLEHFA